MIFRQAKLEPVRVCLPTLQSSFLLQGGYDRHFKKTLFIFCPTGKFIRWTTHAKWIMQMKLLHLELSLFSYSSEHECVRLFLFFFFFSFFFRVFAQL